MRLFGWWRKREPEIVRVHDFKRRFWGHDYTFTPLDDGKRGRCAGWGGDHGLPREGDGLLLANPNNPTGDSLYRVVSARRFGDPSDMWSAEVEFVERKITQ